MTIQWSLFVPGAWLLDFPADRLRSSLVELRSFGRLQSREGSLPGQHSTRYIDLAAKARRTRD